MYLLRFACIYVAASHVTDEGLTSDGGKEGVSLAHHTHCLVLGLVNQTRRDEKGNTRVS